MGWKSQPADALDPTRKSKSRNPVPGAFVGDYIDRRQPQPQPQPQPMPGSATDFEFRHRFWFIGGVFQVAYLCYVVDDRNMAVYLARAVAPPAGAGTTNAEHLRLIAWLGVVVVSAAAALRTWGVAYLHSEVVYDTSLHTERMVADGPYRHVRNPLYLGTMLLALGLAVTTSVTGAGVLLLGMAVLLLRLIGREEVMLVERHGDPFRRYLERVPRLVPSVRPRVDASGALPRWPQAFAGETFMWSFVVGSAVFAATFDVRAASAILLAGVVVYLLQRAAERRRGVGAAGDPPDRRS